MSKCVLCGEHDDDGASRGLTKPAQSLIVRRQCRDSWRARAEAASKRADKWFAIAQELASCSRAAIAAGPQCAVAEYDEALMEETLAAHVRLKTKAVQEKECRARFGEPQELPA